MTTTHTPGKWIVRDIPSRDYYIGPADDGGAPSIAIVTRRHNRTEAQTEANARLIASAPDLLAALKAITCTYRTFRNVPKDEQEWTSTDDEALDNAFAVLARARGTA